MKTIKLTESDLKNIVNKVLEEQESPNYMFFSNLEQIIRQSKLLLDLDPRLVDEILTNGHDWADDHITVAKENLDQVFDFMMNETKNIDNPDNEEITSPFTDDGNILDEGLEINEKAKKNTPTNPSLWKKSLDWAKSRYKVCPSAYCNGAAAKHYKSLGGKWKKK